mmetsp:Transcript_12697/g.15761  ORF Transcript_12697/g.15761 Transcript_12697/m.15761 type:complete len:280 (+) Transcript_12697:229-1068(+)|eukprot:CAMPEP_0204844716 /NCGR_PEP_ID=MMETSP1347-20130617/486_1 /ASSEMBLY_ACC=CAM_ASM_000690 /TAXON_ID=215587 /ORGANISM="Aplanochytrium stocchinoi, Strain GSBS06" /LENGTH=279 /DNA_ID=CAMNT_0051984289 /DNA_START=101 /DNA_END=940 /DNA_ORIENTATION=-
MAGNNSANFCTIILVAKFPRIGKCKTRLAKQTDNDFAQKFAKACIGDLVDKFGNDFVSGNYKVKRVILFAPGTDKDDYRKWLEEECPETSSNWDLLPMKEPTEKDAAIGALGAALGGSIIDISSRNSLQNNTNFGPVSFIGMDTPHLPTKVVAESFAIASTCSIEKNKVLNEVLGDPFTEGAVQETAYICPAYDGGYVLLSLPPAVANGNNAYRAFENVAWSTSEACSTQVKALKDVGFKVKYGAVYTDIDDLEDLHVLKDKLASDNSIDCPRLRKLLL